MLTLNFEHSKQLEGLQIRDLVLQHRLVLIRGIEPLPATEFEQLVAHLAGGHDYLLRWEFGYLMEVQEDESKGNYLFTNEPVPMHWDGAFHVSPFVLAFQCAGTASAGGGTTFCDTTKVWHAATEKERAEWSQLNLVLRTEKKAHYGGSRVFRLVDQHPVTGEPVLRAAERVLTTNNPVEVSLTGPASKDWLSEFSARFYDPAYAVTHEWQLGDILFADNHALLHGRHSFSGNARRCLRRVQILK